MAKTKEQLIVEWYGLVQEQNEAMEKMKETQAKLDKLKAKIDGHK